MPSPSLCADSRVDVPTPEAHLRRDLESLLDLVTRSFETDHKGIFDYATYRLYAYSILLDSLELEESVEKLQLAFLERGASGKEQVQDCRSIVDTLVKTTNPRSHAPT